MSIRDTVQVVLIIMSALLMSSCGGGGSTQPESESASEQIPEPEWDSALSGSQSVVESSVTNGNQANIGQSSPIGSSTDPDITALSVVIHPENPTTISDITVSHDGIEDKQRSFNYHWWKNSEVVSVGIEPVFDQSLIRGDELEVELRETVGDDLLISRSRSIVVGNTLPMVAAELLPENPTAHDTLFLRSLNATDADGDHVQHHYSWELLNYKTGATEAHGSRLSLDLSALDQDYSKVTLYLTSYDGIDEVVNVFSKDIPSSPMAMKTEGLISELAYGEPIEFRLVFVDGNSNEQFGRLITGPFGMTYKNGLVNWTPKTLMLNETETFEAVFEDPSGQKNKVSFTVVNAYLNALVKIEDDSIWGVDNDLSTAGWFNGTNTQSTFVFVLDRSGARRQSVGFVDHTGGVSVVDIDDVWENPGHLIRTVSKLVDTNNDGSQELVFSSSRNGLPAIQHRALPDLSLIGATQVEESYAEEMLAWEDSSDAQYSAQGKSLHISGLTMLDDANSVNPVAFTTTTRWELLNPSTTDVVEGTEHIVERLHVVDKLSGNITHTDIPARDYNSALENNISIASLRDTVNSVIVGGAESRKWNFDDDVFSYQAIVDGNCFLIQQMVDENSTLCLQIKYDVWCEASCYGSSANVEVLSLDPESWSSSRVLGWRYTCEFDSQCVTTFLESDVRRKHNISVPTAAVHLNDSTLMVADNNKKLFLMSTETGELMAIVDTPIVDEISEIHCESTEVDDQHCVLRTVEGIMYLLNKSLAFQ